MILKASSSWIGAALGALLMAVSTAPARASQHDVVMLDHVLRRFAFSAPPETANALLAESGGAWLAAANRWVDSQLSLTVDTNSVPLQAPPAAPVTWSNSDPNYEAGYVEHSIGTNQQLRAKLQLHWIDMFSVTGSSTSPPAMYIYQDLLWENALGNFQTLLTEVSETPAELWALSNNDSNGNDPTTPPNVNFAREVMQIFSIGPVKLHMDGTPVRDAHGVPVPNYGPGDIYTLAYTMTGFSIQTNNAATDARQQLYPQFASNRHYWGTPLTYAGYNLTQFLGKPFNAFKNLNPFPAVVSELAHNPSAAPFQAKQLIQRFVTENPSPAYVERIANVWAANVDSPRQIAVVIKAILNDPEFASSYQSMTKQPIEKMFGFLRQLPGTFAPLTAATPNGATTQSGANSLIWALGNMGQDPNNPVDVFSFYPIGAVEQASNTISNVQWLQQSSWIISAPNAGTGVWIDIPTLRARIAKANNVAVSAINGVMAVRYIAAAMIDASPQQVDNFAINGGPANNPIVEALSFVQGSPTDDELRLAIWVIAASPEYNVN
jgi:uncharacterized protein (DUF1800 family)